MSDSKTNPFDPSRFAVSSATLAAAQGHGDGSVVPQLTGIGVRKPSKQEYIRTDDRPAMQIVAPILELKSENEMYLCTPDVAAMLPGDVVKCGAPARFEVRGKVVTEQTIVLEGDRNVYVDCSPTGQVKHEELVFNYVSVADDECWGILQINSEGGVFLDDGRGSEYICAINPDERDRVLADCNIGHFCRITGSLGSCGDNSECIMMSKIKTAKAQ